MKYMAQKRLLVHLHLFYTVQTDYFLEKLSSIGNCDWTLFLTLPEPSEEIERKFRSFHNDTVVMYPGNRGYDLWPFIYVLQSVDLDEWDYILKLHTKSFQDNAAVNGIRYRGYRWRDKIVDTYLKDRRTFCRMISLIDSPDTGMLCNRLFYRNVSGGLPEDLSILEKELKRVGIVSGDRHFCAGSIFMAKAAPFKQLQTPLINADIFGEKAESHTFGTMAHVYERIVSIVVTAAGLRIVPVVTDRLVSVYLDVGDALQPVLEQLFSIRRIGEERKKVLTIFGINIPLK